MLSESYKLLLLVRVLFSSLSFFLYTPCLADCVFSGDYHVDQNTLLDGSCSYKGSFYINKGHVQLNCNGAVLDGGGRLNYGVVVDSNGKFDVANIVIKNCKIRDYKKSGVLIGWRIPDDEKSGYQAKDKYRMTPHDINLENVSIHNSGMVGVYIDDFVSGVVVDRSEIVGSGGAGLYFEFNSKDNVIRNSFIAHNGFAHFREGVAVDSSSFNLIADNQLVGNYSGGVFIYKNCWENASENPHSIRREMSADYNIVDSNIISDSPVGVWVASRQSKNLRGMKCGDPSYFDNRYYRDYAKNNLIKNNEFHRVSRGVIVEDDSNVVSSNSFHHADVAIKVGSQTKKDYLGESVVNVKVHGNRFDSVRKPIELVGGASIVER